MKRLLVVFTLVLSLGLLAACEPTDNPPECLEDQIIVEGECVDKIPDEQMELTLDELAMYDGKDGNPAYVAIDGIIYDVTNHDEWRNGEHKGAMAGTDITDTFNNEHGMGVLDDVPQVGTIVEDDGLLSLTLEELAMYNGEDGNPAYIAVNGVIYDVTNVTAWSSGSHNGGVAGTDITDLISGAPHMDGVLDDLEVVGQIVE